ncbi:MAG: response regulator [Gammaproteobacteria bacterium]|jgi:CheY-like chemotaxis protein|nr:response regulator [Gammaproteobacteria bacterium]
MSALQTLVVDDSASARNVLKRLLERKGAQVDQSESGIQALDYLKTKKPDIIFMDHTMPGMSGLEAIRAMRSNPDTATIPVVMYTSENDEAYKQEAMATGAVGVIPKPATWNKISEVLAGVAYQRPAQADQIASSIDQQLTSLRDHLTFTMEKHIQRVGDELQQNIDQRLRQVEQGQSGHSTYPAKGLATLIHSITDSKLHQLNLELRHHITAKFDVLAQDLTQTQVTLKQDILQEVDLRIRANNARRRQRRLLRIPQLLRDRWYLIPFWLAVALMGGVVALWIS